MSMGYGALEKSLREFRGIAVRILNMKESGPERAILQ